MRDVGGVSLVGVFNTSFLSSATFPRPCHRPKSGRHQDSVTAQGEGGKKKTDLLKCPSAILAFGLANLWSTDKDSRGAQLSWTDQIRLPVLPLRTSTLFGKLRPPTSANSLGLRNLPHLTKPL